MSEQSGSALDAAVQMAEAVRALNHATVPAGGWPGLDGTGDIYSVVGALSIGVERLPQACDQCAAYLADRRRAGSLCRDGGGDVGERVTAAAAGFAAAGHLANRLVVILREVQSALADVAEADVAERENS